MRGALHALLALVLISGCERKPSAPVLRDEPVYDNPRDGLRFRSPEGWVQVAKSDFLADTSDKDYLLVRYQNNPPSASLELSRADVPESENLEELLAKQSHGSVGPWRSSGKPEVFSIGGVSATRYEFTNQTKTKETTAVRRGARVYFFTVITPTADKPIRDELHRIISDVKWTK